MTKDIQITIRLSSDQLERAQKLADKIGVSRHKLFSAIVDDGIKKFELLDSIGFINAALLVNSAQELMKLAVSVPEKSSKAQKA